MVIQREILISVFTTISCTLALAWIVLCVCTINWIVATLCLVCFFVILIVFTFFLAAAGNGLGVIEAIGLIMAVGLSVDYTVHIGHSFNEQRYIEGREASRGERVTLALTEMGISVSSGAWTTFIAALFMLPCHQWFFVNFGKFMIIIVITSYLVSITLLPSLLATLGPQQTQGDIMWIQTLGKKVFSHEQTPVPAVEAELAKCKAAEQSPVDSDDSDSEEVAGTRAAKPVTLREVAAAPEHSQTVQLPGGIGPQ